MDPEGLHVAPGGRSGFAASPRGVPELAHAETGDAVRRVHAGSIAPTLALCWACMRKGPGGMRSCGHSTHLLGNEVQIHSLGKYMRQALCGSPHSGASFH